MSIKKMIMLASMAMAIIAFAAPAVAQANVELTEGGVALEEGAEVTATSTNLKTTVGPNTLSCALVTLHYTVATNGPEHVVLKPTPLPHNATTKECHVITPMGTVPVTITESGTKDLTINTWGTGITEATFRNGGCLYTGGVHIQATGSGTDGIRVGQATGSTLAGNPLAQCGHGLIHGDAKLETSNGTAVTIDFTKTG